MQIKHLQSLVRRSANEIETLELQVKCYKGYLSPSKSDCGMVVDYCEMLARTRKKLAKIVELQKALKKSLAFAVGQQKYIH